MNKSVFFFFFFFKMTIKIAGSALKTRVGRKHRYVLGLIATCTALIICSGQSQLVVKEQNVTR